MEGKYLYLLLCNWMDIDSSALFEKYLQSNYLIVLRVFIAVAAALAKGSTMMLSAGSIMFFILSLSSVSFALGPIGLGIIISVALITGISIVAISLGKEGDRFLRKMDNLYLKALTPQQIMALTPEQIKAITPKQNELLNDDQREAVQIRLKQISGTEPEKKSDKLTNMKQNIERTLVPGRESPPTKGCVQYIHTAQKTSTDVNIVTQCVTRHINMELETPTTVQCIQTPAISEKSNNTTAITSGQSVTGNTDSPRHDNRQSPDLSDLEANKDLLPLPSYFIEDGSEVQSFLEPLSNKSTEISVPTPVQPALPGVTNSPESNVGNSRIFELMLQLNQNIAASCENNKTETAISTSDMSDSKRRAVSSYSTSAPFTRLNLNTIGEEPTTSDTSNSSMLTSRRTENNTAHEKSIQQTNNQKPTSAPERCIAVIPELMFVSSKESKRSRSAPPGLTSKPSCSPILNTPFVPLIQAS